MTQTNSDRGEHAAVATLEIVAEALGVSLSDCPADQGIGAWLAGLIRDSRNTANPVAAQAQPTIKESLTVEQPVSGADGLPIELRGVLEAVAEGDGFWRSCSGCHELNEGHDTGPQSKFFKCALGNGCSECGGIGAIWDSTDYDAMGDALAASMAPPQPSGNAETIYSDDPRYGEEIKALDEAWKNGICHAVGEYTAAKIAWLKRAAQPQPKPSGNAQDAGAWLADGLESIKGNENAARAAAVLRQLSDAKWDQRAEDSAIVGRMSRMLAEISALVSPDVPLENHYFADLVERVRVAVAPPAAQGEALAAPLNNSKILDLAISSGMTADDGVYRGNAAAVLRFAGALRRVAMELDTRGFTALEVLRVIRMSMGWQSLSDECRKLVDAALKENGNG